MIDSVINSVITELNKYCINFKGLLVTHKAALKITNSKYIIAPDNFINISSKE